MSNPGLTAEWASIVLDSHQKHFADECAICFSEIHHDFRIADLNVRAEEQDDVASAGTVESDDFATCSRPANYVAQDINSAASGLLANKVPDSYTGLGTVSANGLEQGGLDLMHVCGSSSPTESCGSFDRPEGAGSVRMTQTAAPMGNMRTSGMPEPRQASGSLVHLDEGCHPDLLADSIMKQPVTACTKEQLDFLYKTCRCVLMTCTTW